jgi:hypothetical protein
MVLPVEKGGGERERMFKGVVEAEPFLRLYSLFSFSTAVHVGRPSWRDLQCRNTYGFLF